MLCQKRNPAPDCSDGTVVAVSAWLEVGHSMMVGISSLFTPAGQTASQPMCLPLPAVFVDGSAELVDPKA